MNDNSASNIDAAVPAEHGVAPTVQQVRVLEELRRKDRQLADMYLGAIHVLGQTSNPVRFALAAHALREVMEKLGERVGAPIAGGPSLKQRVRQLRQEWPDTAITSVFEKGTDSTSSAKPVHDFLSAARVFFEWFDRNLLSRREQIVRLLVTTDPLQRHLSAPIEKVHVAQWLDTRDRLLAIAHHGRYPTEMEFRQVFDMFDSLLLDRLRPRAFEQQDEIDRIIAEGESPS